MTNLTLLSDKRTDAAKIILPAALAVLLFIVTVFSVLLPSFQTGLFDNKKKSSRALVNVSIDILAHYDALVKSTGMPLTTAQEQAMALISELRYGTEEKDYFWINDLTPRMVMHPYRPDLNGKDLNQFLDPDGTPLFVNVARIAKEQGAGFVPYLWQHQDNQKKIKHKLSYVELFAPWGWVVGTGVYLENAAQEVSNITQKVIYMTCAMLTGVILLSAYMIRHGMKVEKKRRMAEKKLREHEEQLEELVNVRTRDLERALAEVKKLSGFLPICASCKKIRDDSGYWQQIEVYIRNHSEAQFSHGICPECVKVLYPELKMDDFLSNDAKART